MKYRDNNNEPYRIGHIYYMYSHHLEIIEFQGNGAVLLQRRNEPRSTAFSLSLVNGWRHIGPAHQPKNNREALSLLEKE